MLGTGVGRIWLSVRSVIEVGRLRMIRPGWAGLDRGSGTIVNTWSQIVTL